MAAPHEQLRSRRRVRQATAAPSQAIESKRPRARRRWAASLGACLVGVMAARLPSGSLVAGAAVPPRTDGVTYCWQLGASAYASYIKADSVQVQEAKQDECPLSLSLTLNKDSYIVGESIQATWTATLRRNSTDGFVNNTFSIQQLYAAQDRISQKPFEVLFSRVESCAATQPDCDPVLGNTTLISNVANKPANFSDAGVASFSTDKIAFMTAGSVRLVAHVVMPGGENAEQSRLDFAMFKTVIIADRPTLMPVRNESGASQSEKDKSTGASTKSSGMSTQVIGIMFVCGMVAVALVAVGFVMIRKNKNELAPMTPDVRKGPDERRTRAEGTSTTDMDDEFAMLSNNEMLMMSQGARKNGTANSGGSSGGGFLSANAQPQQSMLAESRRAAKAKAQAPLPYVGQVSSRGHPRSEAPDPSLASDDHIVDTSNPASMRHHGLYLEMPSQQPSRVSKKYHNEGDMAGLHHPPPNRPKQNHNMGNSMASTMNPYAASARAPQLMPPESIEDSAQWRVSTELTFDDLRQSVDQGPALTLDDLLEGNKQGRKPRGGSER
jgi:hypothetical protein